MNERSSLNYWMPVLVLVLVLCPGADSVSMSGWAEAVQNDSISQELEREDPEEIDLQQTDDLLLLGQLQSFLVALALSFSFIHFLLFVFSPVTRTHLYFSFFALFFAANIFFDYQASMASSPSSEFLFLRFHRAFMPVNALFLLLFLYSLFDRAVPRHFWAITGVILVATIFAVIEPVDFFDYLQIAQLAVFFEATRVLVQSALNRKKGSWTVSLGLLLLFLFSSYDFLLDLRLMEPVGEINNGYPFGFACLLVATSISLAREFADRNRKILEQESRAQKLALEDERKSAELQQAKELQLSMLPLCANDLPGFDLCFSMRTATEVGGDYYDYRVDGNKLLVAVGDATGHGMKAGVMVSLIKSLFVAEESSTGSRAFAEKCSLAIRKMNLGNLYMALLLAEFDGNNLTFFSAGMPPVLIYRAETGTVEEKVTRSMPLGGPGELADSVTMSLDVNDVVVLLTDGLTELFNSEKEMLDYPRVIQKVKDLAGLSAGQIAEGLFSFADDWKREATQNDDITIVVVKILSL